MFGPATADGSGVAAATLVAQEAMVLALHRARRHAFAGFDG